MPDAHATTLKQHFSMVKRSFLANRNRACNYQAMLDNDSMKMRLREAIDASGVTQVEIAHAFNITEQAVSGWLRTGKIDKRRLPKLAALVKRDLAYFMPGVAVAPLVPATTTRGRGPSIAATVVESLGWTTSSPQHAKLAASLDRATSSGALSPAAATQLAGFIDALPPPAHNMDVALRAKVKRDAASDR